MSKTDVDLAEYNRTKNRKFFKGSSKVLKRLSQQEFLAVEYFIQGFNKKESMLKAGYSESYAETRNGMFFKRKRIETAVERRRFDMKTRSNKIMDRVQDELAKIAFFNIGHFIEVDDNGDLVFDYSDADMDQFAAIGEVTIEHYMEGRGDDAREVKRVKVKPYDKKAALDSLARIHGMFNDSLTVKDETSLEARLARGRARVAGKLNAPDVVDGDFEEVDAEEVDWEEVEDE